MASKNTGGCLCGAVRYEFSGDVLAAVHCHCNDCQKVTGSGFTTVIGVAKTGFRLCSGADTLAEFTVKAESGREVTREFCQRCGSPLFSRPEMNQDMVWIKAGSLDDSSGLEPTAACWTKRARTWAPPMEGVVRFEGNPPG